MGVEVLVQLSASLSQVVQLALEMGGVFGALGERRISNASKVTFGTNGLAHFILFIYYC